MDQEVAGFTIGRRGVLLGTPVHVIGWARWRTYDGYVYYEVTLRTEEAERWTLELDAGHVLLVREVDDAEYGDPTGFVAGTRATIDGVARWAWPISRAELEHVEGEYWRDLTPGDVLEMRSFFKSPTVLGASREMGDPEWEWSQGVYLDRGDLEEGFPAEDGGPILDSGWYITEPHAARPYPYRAWARHLNWFFLVAGVAGLVAAAVVGGGSGAGTLFDESIVLDAPKGETVLGIFDSDQDQTVGIRLAATGLDNRWTWAQVLLSPVPPEGADEETFEPQTLGQFDAELGFYSGYDSDGSWTEDDTKASEGFRIGTGTYMVHLAFERDPTLAVDPTLQVSVVAGYRTVGWLIAWSVVSLVLALIFYLAKRAHWNKVLVEAGLREESDD